ncbi:EAL domain-containing protein [Flaviflagellibacter deserti]|uniref:EAL domain-containing protein n=1 Tax=Flaviflagellibacter deserti TaxID=2267266 RepID=A0ABV9YZ99_9HYPH
MAAIAASLAAILILGLGISVPFGVAGGLAGLGVVALVVRILTGSQKNAPLRLFDVEERVSTLSARLHMIDQRFARLEQILPEALKRNNQGLEREVSDLGNLVRALAEQVELHEQLWADATTHAAAPPPALAREPMRHEPVPRVEIHAPVISTPAPAPQASVARAPLPEFRPVNQDVGRKVRKAIEGEGIELHLSPIAMLPQRRVIHYDTLPYLRDADGTLIGPADFVPDTRATGLLPMLDTFVLDRSLRVARRLKARERELTLFVNLAAETFRGDVFATEIARRLDANADLSSHLMLGFSQEALHSFGGVEAEMLATLSEKGFRFVLTGVTNLSLDAKALNEFGIRVVRIAADLLIDEDAAAESSIHPADLPNVCRRNNILVIADNVDTEQKVADLLDIDVRAAQGTVFGTPRPVRPEVFADGEALASARTPAFTTPAARPGVQPHQPFRSIVRRV